MEVRLLPPPQFINSSGKGHTMTDRQYVSEIYRDMLNYWYDNIGNKSKYAGEIITPRMIQVLTIRYLELGGKLPFNQDEVNWETIERV